MRHTQTYLLTVTECGKEVSEPYRSLTEAYKALKPDYSFFTFRRKAMGGEWWDFGRKYTVEKISVGELTDEQAGKFFKKIS